MIADRKKQKKRGARRLNRVLLTSYVIVMGISFVLAIFILVTANRRETNNRLYLSDFQTLETFNWLLDSTMKEITNVSSDIMVNETVQSMFQAEGENVTRTTGEYLKNMVAEREEIQSVHLITLDKEIISEYKKPAAMRDDEKFLSQFDFQEVDDRQGSAYWRAGVNVMEGDTRSTFYVARMIKSKKTLQPVGYIVLYMTPDALQSVAESFLGSTEFSILLLCGGEYISFPENGLLYENRDELVVNAKEYQSFVSGGQSYYYVSMENNNYGVDILGMSIQKRMNKEVAAAVLFALMLNVFFLLIASIVIRNRVTRPLEEITRQSALVGRGSGLDVRFDAEHSFLEVEEIADSLNEMMDQIENLVNEVQVREKLQKRLELSLINHQVKPHFLYNTLNAASVLVSVGEKENANELIKALAKYYRACLSRGKDRITVEEELNIVREYVKISLIRNPDVARVTYEVDPRMLNKLIPKITIQSLVENSMKYGIKNMDEAVEIRITVEPDTDSSQMLITVRDNGSGMDKETICRVTEGREVNVKSGFGLKAIITRISLYYDIADYHDIIRIDSKTGEYTQVVLKIPCEEREGGGNGDEK